MSDLVQSSCPGCGKPLEGGNSVCFPRCGNGLVAWTEVLQGGFAGHVAKDEASPYVGGVTRSWLKVKVPGWTDPDDRWKRVWTTR